MWLSPTLSGWATGPVAISWLKVSRAERGERVTRPMGADGNTAAPSPKHTLRACTAQTFHLAACQMKLVVSAPVGAAIYEPFRWRLKVSPMAGAWGVSPSALALTESRRMAAGRIRGRFAYQPRPFTPRIAPLRAFFLCHAMGGLNFHEFPIVVRTSTLHSRKETIGTHVLS